MILTGYCRVGQDVSLRYTNDGTAVANISLAFNYGRKGDDGKRPSQWVDASLWGQRAESLAEYLLKGTGLDVVLEDVHIETYQRSQGGEGSKLVGRVVILEFAGSTPQQQGSQGGASRSGGADRPQGQRSNPTARGGQQPQHGQSTRGGDGFEDSDIPFGPAYARAGWSAV